MTDPAAVRRRPRHLMDPNAPRPVRDTRAEVRSLTRVQRWVASTLAVTTILHLTAGLIVAAMFLPEPTLAAQIGLNVIAGAFAVIAIAAGRAIHGKSFLSWWLALAVLPTLLGVWLTLR
jgi:hypothetical protein